MLSLNLNAITRKVSFEKRIVESTDGYDPYVTGVRVLEPILENNSGTISNGTAPHPDSVAPFKVNALSNYIGPKDISAGYDQFVPGTRVLEPKENYSGTIGKGTAPHPDSIRKSKDNDPKPGQHDVNSVFCVDG